MELRDIEIFLTLAQSCTSAGPPNGCVSPPPASPRPSRNWARPDITCLPIRDIDPLPYALVWRSAAENDLIRAFARVAADLGAIAA